MKPHTFLCILLSFGVLCIESTSGDTFELPKADRPATPFQMEEVTIGGQTRYRILTEHYDITAAQAEDGKRVGERLEHLANVWTLLLAEFVKEEKDKPASHRHRIILYRDKQEYTLNLRRFDLRIAETNGFYYEPNKTAYFFSMEEKILLHEGTHQILAEHFAREKLSMYRNNFWIVEGIALFMQTLKVEDKHYKVGDILADRLFSAKVYRLEQNHHLPIRQLTAMNRTRFQNRSGADLQRMYSQSATLVHWLMFAEEGRYRGALFELLRQTYLDAAKPESLSELTGLSYEELDKKYAEFLKVIPE